MKTKSLIAIAVMAFSATAFAQMTDQPSTTTTTDQPSTTTTTDQGGQEQTESQTQSTTPSDTANMTPKQVCQQLVQAAKTQTSQSQKLDQWVYRDRETRGAKTAMPQRDWIKREISSANCGDETIAGDHAFVVSRSGDDERLLPFIKQGNAWKLDMHSYRAFYRMDKRVPASK